MQKCLIAPYPFFQQQYIDIEAMCKSLHGKYPEYNRKKFRVFKEQVETAFQKLLSGGAPSSRDLIDIPDLLGLSTFVWLLPVDP